MNPSRDLVLVANTRMPSQRAQALQVAQFASACVRAGAPTSVLHARRRPVIQLPVGVDALDWYGVPKTARPELVPVPNIDWIDRVPRILQYVPARLQEQSFARNAKKLVRERFAGARVLSREVETALLLVRDGHARTFLEIHRVPGGRLRRRWLLEAGSSCVGVVAISEGVAHDLAELGLARASITVEHDAYEPARFMSRPTKLEARRALDLPLDVPLVVYTGGLMKWKGVDLLVEAARAMPAVYFVIAGGMEHDVKELRQKTGGLANVRIDGFQPPDRIVTYLSAGDVGVAPNRSEPAISARHTSPLKVFEAMAAGLPLVVSDLPSMREILADEVDAIFVAPDESKALRLGLEKLLRDESLRTRLSARLLERALGHTWDARAARMIAWMDEREARVRAGTKP